MAKAGFKCKNDYQKRIAGYLERREQYKTKYGKNSERYLKLSKNLQKKLTIWRGAIKRIEARDQRMRNIDGMIKEFIGRSAWKCIHSTDELTVMAKNLFFKYGIENGIAGVFLADYAGLKFRQDASRYRLQFTRSFKTNRHNHEMWHRFKTFIERVEYKIAA